MATLLLLLYMVLAWFHVGYNWDLAGVVAAAAAAGTSAVGLGMVVVHTAVGVVVVAVVAAAGHTADIAWVAGLLLAGSWPPLEGQPYRLLHT